MSARRRSFSWSASFVVAAALLFTALFTDLAFDFHAGMRTHKADLGQIDQAVWNSSRGRLLQTTDNGYIATRMTDHVEPILVVISPIFWVWNDVRALLLLQVVMAAAGAWLIYRISTLLLDGTLTSRQRATIWEREPAQQLTRPLAMTVAGAYLLSPQLQSAILTEFHAAPLAVPLILWAFLAIEGRKWGQFLIAALLVAAVKEEMALLAAGLGAWAVYRTWRSGIGDRGGSTSQPRSLLPGSLVTLLALTWFIIATFVIVPAHAAEVYGVAESGYFARYGALGDSALDIFKSFFTQPQRVWSILVEPVRARYFLNLLAPFGFLALLAPEVLLLSLPLLLANQLSAYPAQYYGEFHYSAPLVPYVAVASALGLARLWRVIRYVTTRSSSSFQHLPAASGGAMALAALWQNPRTVARPILALLLALWIGGSAVNQYRLLGRGPLAARHDPTPVTAHHRLLPRFSDQIPADASVTASAAVHPHLSHRQFIYQFPLGLDAPRPADWALLDVTTNTDMAPGDLKLRVEEMLAADWGVEDAADGFLLLRKGAEEKVVPDAFFSFARGSAEASALPGSQLRFAGAAVSDWPRWRESRIHAEWHIGAEFQPPEDGEPPVRLEIISPAGDTLLRLNDLHAPALHWYPPSRWQAEETIRISSQTLRLPAHWGIVVAPGEEGAGLQLAGAYSRTEGDRLVPALQRQMPAPLRVSGALEGVELDVEATVLEETFWPGRTINLQFLWSSEAGWPEGGSVFVHLRAGTETVAQQDGAPRWFLPADVVTLASAGVLPDWRQLTIPETLAPGTALHIVAGVYLPAHGVRADWKLEPDAALHNEFELIRFVLDQRPVPDQACALFIQTCAAQFAR